jgi:hypothetical protein
MQFVLCEKNFGWMDVWELNPEGLESLRLKAFGTFWGGGGGILAEGLPDCGLVGHAPFELYPGICLTTEEKHGKPPSG